MLSHEQIKYSRLQFSQKGYKSAKLAKLDVEELKNYLYGMHHDLCDVYCQTKYKNLMTKRGCDLYLTCTQSTVVIVSDSTLITQSACIVNITYILSSMIDTIHHGWILYTQ